MIKIPNNPQIFAKQIFEIVKEYKSLKQEEDFRLSSYEIDNICFHLKNRILLIEGIYRIDEFESEEKLRKLNCERI